jgi:hypothetical protein
MNDIQGRQRQALALWAEGDLACARGDDAEAYRLYTEGHDLITDCPRLHREAHVKLRAVNQRTGNTGEYITDTVLVALAPFGVFELIALALRSKVARTDWCRRTASA